MRFAGFDEGGGEEGAELLAGDAAGELAFEGVGDGAGFLGDDDDKGVGFLGQADRGAVAGAEGGIEVFALG